MNLTLAESQDLIFKLKSEFINKKNVDVVVCPPFVYLSSVASILKNTLVKIGAQNIFFKDAGAFTGEISGKMLKDLNIDMVIIGHSERRQFFKESNEAISLKLKAALKYNLIPILCVGEDLTIREKEEAEIWVKNQLLSAINGLSLSEIENLIFAYEPIWAIGTGKICSGNDANKIIKMIRNTVKEKSSDAISQKVRILYGGSIKSSNFNEHIQYEDIDGGLVGGASLSFEEFIKIIDLAKAKENTANYLHQSKTQSQ